MTSEERDVLVVSDCQRRLRHIKTHYFEKECAVSCPCYTLETAIDLSNIVENEVIFVSNFADELCITLLRLLPAPSFLSLISTCKRLYTIGTTEKRLFPNIDLYRRTRPKRYLVSTPKLEPNIKAVFAIVDEVIRDAHEFTHDLHTCFNESINSSRTKDLPKDKLPPHFCKFLVHRTEVMHVKLLFC